MHIDGRALNAAGGGEGDRKWTIGVSLLQGTCFLKGTILLPMGIEILLADRAYLPSCQLKKITIVIRVLDITDDKITVEIQ
ncbi:hypothetical protein SDC9_04886 [bioreactor metagenome]|uniref:Uncharacterized protein n=1 Tax=bioreactor metagenome TaxID=1076179 RepID=A0A644SXH6_9ZZZZ